MKDLNPMKMQSIPSEVPLKSATGASKTPTVQSRDAHKKALASMTKSAKTKTMKSL